MPVAADAPFDRRGRRGDLRCAEVQLPLSFGGDDRVALDRCRSVVRRVDEPEDAGPRYRGPWSRGRRAAWPSGGFDSPQQHSKAVIDDAATQLGITPAKLSDALKKALENRVDAEVAVGTITKAHDDALKARIESAEYPVITGGLGFGGHDHDQHGSATCPRGRRPWPVRERASDAARFRQVARQHCGGAGQVGGRAGRGAARRREEQAATRRSPPGG